MWRMTECTHAGICEWAQIRDEISDFNTLKMCIINDDGGWRQRIKSVR